ncbi:MAG: hypothetical protein ACYDCT_03670 [Dehalococcoidia bacterium]
MEPRWGLRALRRGGAGIGLALAASTLVSACLLTPLPLVPRLPDPATPTPAASIRTQALPPVPGGWPATTLQLGMADNPGAAAAMKATAPFAFRYQYLAGGVNTGNGWATWNAGGQFATYYIQDSIANGIVPVFTYYMMFQSSPGNTMSEAAGDLANIQNTATMTAYYNDLKLFFQRAGAFPTNKVVLHVEPDLWGYLQQAATNDDATTVPAQVAATGLPELAGLPNNVAGFAQAITLLRDTYAPNVLLAYHLSIWGTGTDIVYSKPDNATLDALAARSANFYTSLHSGFDLSFAEFSDRDAAFKQFVYGDGGASWWGPADFARNVRYLSDFSTQSATRIVIWQIPLGNTKMRAMNNTWDHYQDNHVEWLLDDPTRTNLNAYAQAGVIAFLFGRGADGATCACDALGDGVTNPAPINGNTTLSLSADDDGGFFRQKAAAYYAAGTIPLAGGGIPTATPTPTTTAIATATATRTPTPAGTPAATQTPLPVVLFGRTATSGSNDNSDFGYVNGSRFTLSTQGTLTALSLYVGATPPGAHVRLALYGTSGTGDPGALLAQTGDAVATVGWNTLAVPGGPLLAPGTYWIAAQTDNTGTVYRVAAGLTSSDFVGWAPQTYGPFPAGISGWTKLANQSYAMYGTVSTLPPPTATPTSPPVRIPPGETVVPLPP